MATPSNIIPNEAKNVDVGDHHYVAKPERQQNQEAANKKRLYSNAPQLSRLRSHGDPNAERQRERSKRFEFDKFRRKKIDRVIEEAGVGVKVQNVIEQGDAEEIQAD